MSMVLIAYSVDNTHTPFQFHIPKDRCHSINIIDLSWMCARKMPLVCGKPGDIKNYTAFICKVYSINVFISVCLRQLSHANHRKISPPKKKKKTWQTIFKVPYFRLRVRENAHLSATKMKTHSQQFPFHSVVLYLHIQITHRERGNDGVLVVDKSVMGAHRSTSIILTMKTLRLFVISC